MLAMMARPVRMASQPAGVSTTSLARPSLGSGRRSSEAVGFELVDELGHRGAGHPGPGGEVGQPGAFGLDVAEHMQVTEP